MCLLTGGLAFWALTANGYANNWYAGGALAASRSWKAFIDNAADLSGVVSLDKGPLSDWMMGLSVRVLGFSSLSLLLPDALCGIASVVVLHDAVRRTMGHRAALVAALTLALSPVSVVMNRYDDPEALLALLLVASAWALVRALESGRLRHICLCGALIGLAFNTKMLEAYLVVPGLAVAFAVAGQGGWRRRLGHLLCAAAVMVTVSSVWFTTMMLLPASDRPYVGSTTDNSWFSLIFGYNGLSRLTGAGPGESPTRLLNGAAFGGQIGWLLLAASVGLLAGLWSTRRAARGSRCRAGLLLFGLWAGAGFVVFSFSQGTVLPYYTSAMAPAIGALVGGGAVVLFDRFRSGWGWTVALLAAIAGTAGESFRVLRDTPSFLPWLPWTIVGAATLAALGVLAVRPLGKCWGSAHGSCADLGLRSGGPVGWRGGLLAPLTLGAASVALLGGPTAYAIATVGYGQTGGEPMAGPAQEPNATRVAAAINAPNPALVGYLTAHRDGARYLVAANGSQAADPIILATEDPVIIMGGFSESGTASTVPAPTIGQLRAFIVRGQLRFVIPGPVSFAPARSHWVESRCRAVSVPGATGIDLYLCSRTEVGALRTAGSRPGSSRRHRSAAPRRATPPSPRRAAPR